MTHDELIAALKSATGPDRELDVQVMALAFDWAKPESPYYSPHCVGDEPIYWQARNTAYYKQPCPHFTGSIDAIVKAIKVKWPEADWRIGAASWAIVTPPDHWSLRGNGNTPELSLCIAFVAALKTQKEATPAG